MTKDKVMIGSIRYEHGTFYIKPEYGSADGLNQGLFFKDELAYKNNMNAPCYVPECYFDDEDEVTDSFYTHRSLLEICGYNEELCDACFAALSWQSPEIWLDELEPEDYAHFWNWLHEGGKAYLWSDMEWSTGFYDVVQIDDEPDDWSPDTEVVIRRECPYDCTKDEELTVRLLELAKSNVLKFINNR